MPLKWPWNSQTTPTEPPASPDGHPPTTPPGASGTAFATQADLEVLRLEWAEVLDKLGRWTSRQAARDRRRVDRDLDQLGGDDGDGAQTLQDALGDTNGGGEVVGMPTSARQALKAQLRARIQPRR